MGGTWALWVLHFHVCPWLACCSCIRHDLGPFLVFAARSATHFWPLVTWMSHWAFILHILLLPLAGSCLGMDLSFFNSTLTLFVGRLTLLPCHPVVSVMLLFNLCLLGLLWACCTLSFCSVLVAQYYCWACTHVVLGLLDPFHCFRASFTHFIHLGILGPFHFLKHLRPIPILHSQ